MVNVIFYPDRLSDNLSELSDRMITGPEGHILKWISISSGWKCSVHDGLDDETGTRLLLVH